MLPASEPLGPGSSSDAAVATRWTTALAIAVAVITLLLLVALVGNVIPPQRAYLLFSLPCLAPVILYSYGFLKVNETEQDFGLLLSAVGWALVALTFLIKHNEVASANRNVPPGGVPIVHVPNSPAVYGCLALALLCLALGAVVSWNAWLKDRRNQAMAAR